MLTSLILEVIVELSRAPLSHQQSNLLPVSECIPGYTSIDERLSNLYKFKADPVKLNWLRSVDSFYVDLTEKDVKRKIVNGFITVIAFIQSAVDKEILSHNAKCCMLTHIGPKFKQGWGDYNKESGGYGAFVDHRTGNNFELAIKTVNSKAYFEVNLNYCVVRVVPETV